MHLRTFALVAVVEVVDPIEMAATTPPVETNTIPHLVVLKMQEIVARNIGAWDNGVAGGWWLHRELLRLRRGRLNGTVVAEGLAAASVGTTKAS